MASISQISRFLNKELAVRSIPDASRNGLQYKAKETVKTIAFAVDGCASTFNKAKHADLIIVHHGIYWKPQKYKEVTELRKKTLKKHKLSLYACHLPLDAHKEYGNNIQLAQMLDIEKPKKFGRYNGHAIGYAGKLEKPISLNNLTKKINKKLKTNCIVAGYGKKTLKSVAIVSGGGGDALEEAIKKGYDCLITGEMSQSQYTRARDHKFNLIAAGHYATETVGVKALMPLLREKFGVKTIFIDNPTKI